MSRWSHCGIQSSGSGQTEPELCGHSWQVCDPCDRVSILFKCPLRDSWNSHKDAGVSEMPNNLLRATQIKVDRGWCEPYRTFHYPARGG